METDKLLTVITRLDALLILAERECLEDDDDITAIDALIAAARNEVGNLCTIINQGASA